MLMMRSTGKVSIILGTIEGLQYKRCTSGGYKRSKIWGYQRTRHQQILCKRVSIYVSLENQFSSGDESSIACQKICTMISSWTWPDHFWTPQTAAVTPSAHLQSICDCEPLSSVTWPMPHLTEIWGCSQEMVPCSMGKTSQFCGFPVNFAGFILRSTCEI